MLVIIYITVSYSLIQHIWLETKYELSPQSQILNLSFKLRFSWPQMISLISPLNLFFKPNPQNDT